MEDRMWSNLFLKTALNNNAIVVQGIGKRAVVDRCNRPWGLCEQVLRFFLLFLELYAGFLETSLGASAFSIKALSDISGRASPWWEILFDLPA